MATVYLKKKTQPTHTLHGKEVNSKMNFPAPFSHAHTNSCFTTSVEITDDGGYKIITAAQYLLPVLQTHYMSIYFYINAA